MRFTPSPSVLPIHSLTSRLALSALAAAAVLALSACGGGGGSAASGGGTTGAGSTTYSGAVSGLGSIVVNGARFSTSGASVIESETEGSYKRAFALGTTVSVTGSIDDSATSGSATSITVHGGVRGAVSAVVFDTNSTVTGTLTVAGQTLKVDANTVFEINGATQTLAGLQTLVGAGTVFVEVYAVGDATSGFLATRVEQKASIAEGYAVVGKVVSGSLNTTNKTFNLLLRNGTTVSVDYANAALRPANVTLTEGTAVRVVSTTNPATLGNSSTLTATKLIVKRDRAITGRAKVRGAIATLNGSTLTVNDVTVDVSQAKFDDGLTLANLAVGTVVKVEGTFANGVLVAREVESDGREYAAAGGVKLYGIVSAASPDTPSTFSVQGLTITVPNGKTRPTIGRYVEVVAQQVNGVLTLVKAENEDNRASRSFEVYGTTPCAAGSSDLMGTFTLTLRNGTSTAVDGRNASISLEDGVSMTSGLANAQCLVEVKGAVSSNTITATRIEVKARTAPAAN